MEKSKTTTTSSTTTTYENFQASEINNDQEKIILTAEEMEKLIAKKDWAKLLQHRKDFDNFCLNYSYKLNWDEISCDNSLSEDFMRAYWDKINWCSISQHQRLSIQFMEDFSDYIHWDVASEFQFMTKEFLEANAEKLDLKRLKLNQRACISYIKKLQSEEKPQKVNKAMIFLPFAIFVLIVILSGMGYKIYLDNKIISVQNEKIISQNEKIVSQNDVAWELHLLKEEKIKNASTISNLLEKSSSLNNEVYSLRQQLNNARSKKSNSSTQRIVYRDAPSESSSENSSNNDTEGTFTIGSSKQKVLEVMGTPTKITRVFGSMIWLYYARSKVTIENGRVTEYDNQGGNLKVR